METGEIPVRSRHCDGKNFPKSDLSPKLPVYLKPTRYRRKIFALVYLFLYRVFLWKGER